MRHSRRYDFQGHPRSGSRSGDDLSPLTGLFSHRPPILAVQRYASAVSASVSVISQCSIGSTDWAVFGTEASFDLSYSTLSYKEIRISVSKDKDTSVWNFVSGCRNFATARRASQALTVYQQFDRRQSPVHQTELPHLCTTKWVWRGISCRFVCGRWDLYQPSTKYLGDRKRPNYT